MLLAQHHGNSISLNTLFTTSIKTAMVRAAVVTMVGWLVLTVMSLPIISLPGLGMIAAGLLLAWIINEVEHMQAEAEALEREHHRLVEMANQLMLTPASIK
jgi:hypothetical protein